MRAGRLRHRVVIQQPTAGAANDYGETADTWSTFATVWSEIVPQSAREYQQAQTLRGDMTHLIKIRWYNGVTIQMRVVYKSRNLNIVSVINVGERDREMQLICVEEV